MRARQVLHESCHHFHRHRGALLVGNPGHRGLHLVAGHTGEHFHQIPIDDAVGWLGSGPVRTAGDGVVLFRRDLLEGQDVLRQLQAQLPQNMIPTVEKKLQSIKLSRAK